MKTQTITFTDKKGWFEFTVKREFLKTLVNKNGKKVKPSSLDIEDLVITYDFNRFLHNEKGPAVRYLNKLPTLALCALSLIPATRGLVAYWIDGEILLGQKRKDFVKKLNKGKKSGFTKVLYRIYNKGNRK